jgi:hypothetical protein
MVFGAPPTLPEDAADMYEYTTIEEQVYREDAPGNAVVARARRWRPEVNGRRNDNKSNLLGWAEF